MTDPINMVLSREELLLTLRTLETESIPGIDSDPLGALTSDGLALAHTIAERSLRARGLAQVQADGSVALHNALLTAVGVCAYATQTVFVYHWPEDGEVPIRYFGHIRGEDFVAHTRPEDVLHLFTLLPTKEALLEQILQVCNYEERTHNGSLTLAAADFAQIRGWAREGEVETAVAHLTNQQTETTVAAAFVQTLAQSPHISILQTVKHLEDQAIANYDFTLVQDQQHGWLMTPADEEGGLQVKTAVKADLVALLNNWI